jgi:hypothetical protein
VPTQQSCHRPPNLGQRRISPKPYAKARLGRASSNARVIQGNKGRGLYGGSSRNGKNRTLRIASPIEPTNGYRFRGLGRWRGGYPQRLNRLPQNTKRGAEEQARNETSHPDIRPARGEQIAPGGSQQDTDIRDQVISGAQPGGTQVEVVAPVTVEQKETHQIGRRSTIHSTRRCFARRAAISQLLSSQQWAIRFPIQIR